MKPKPTQPNQPTKTPTFLPRPLIAAAARPLGDDGPSRPRRRPFHVVVHTFRRPVCVWCLGPKQGEGEGEDEGGLYFKWDDAAQRAFNVHMPTCICTHPHPKPKAAPTAPGPASWPQPPPPPPSWRRLLLPLLRLLRLPPWDPARSAPAYGWAVCGVGMLVLMYVRRSVDQSVDESLGGGGYGIWDGGKYPPCHPIPQKKTTSAQAATHPPGLAPSAAPIMVPPPPPVPVCVGVGGGFHY